MAKLYEEAQAQVKDVAEAIEDTVTSTAHVQVERAKDVVAGRIQSVSTAARGGANGALRGSFEQQALARAAAHVDGIAAEIRSADLPTLVAKATQIARAHPAVFVGGACLFGFAAARFLKASGDPIEESLDADPWGTINPITRGGPH